MSLSILCISRGDVAAVPFIRGLCTLGAKLGAEVIICADAPSKRTDFLSQLPQMNARFTTVHSRGYLESVHDDCIEMCSGDYVLRLDDDERASSAMARWLQEQKYLEHDHWKFPRIHLWGNVRSALITKHLFPDHQTRLSVKVKAKGRRLVHAGSPYGGGTEAPVAIMHHKFLVKTYSERLRIAQLYDRHGKGYGTGAMAPFSIPEEAYGKERIILVDPGDGTVPWIPIWEREAIL